MPMASYVVVLGPRLDILVLELVDLEPETIVLELVAAVPRHEAAEHWSYKASDT